MNNPPGFQAFPGATPFGPGHRRPRRAGAPGRVAGRATGRPKGEIIGRCRTWPAHRPTDPADLMGKAAKALATDGPSFLNILSPCPTRLAHRRRRDHRPCPAGHRDLRVAALRSHRWRDASHVSARPETARQGVCSVDRGRFGASLRNRGARASWTRYRLRWMSEWSRLLEAAGGDPLKSPGETSLAAGRDGTQAEWRQVPECGVAGARQSE